MAFSPQSDQFFSLIIRSEDTPDAASIERKLRDGEYSVGGSLVHDIALAQCPFPDILVIDVNSGQPGKSTIRALMAGVVIDGTAAEIGQSLSLQSTSLVTAGPVMMTIAASQGLAARQGTADMPGLNGALVKQSSGKLIDLQGFKTSRLYRAFGEVSYKTRVLFGCSLAFLMVGLGLSALDTGPSKSNPGVVATAGRVQFSEPMQYVKAVLTATDLAHLVTPAKRGNRIVLSGRVTQEQASRIQTAMGDFKTRYATPVEYAYELYFAEGSDNGVQGIILGPEPYVIDQGGLLVSIGGTLKSGWTFTGMSDSGATLTKAGASQIFALPFDTRPTAGIEINAMRGSVEGDIN